MEVPLERTECNEKNIKKTIRNDWHVQMTWCGRSACMTGYFCGCWIFPDSAIDLTSEPRDSISDKSWPLHIKIIQKTGSKRIGLKVCMPTQRRVGWVHVMCGKETRGHWRSSGSKGRLPFRAIWPGLAACGQKHFKSSRLNTMRCKKGLQKVHVNTGRWTMLSCEGHVFARVTLA